MGEKTENSILTKLDSMQTAHAKALYEVKITVDAMEVTVAKMDSKIVSLDEALIGTYKSKGWFTRIANLEDSEGTRKKITVAAVIAAIGSAIAAVFHAIKFN